jgi:hypothetical protein
MGQLTGGGAASTVRAMAGMGTIPPRRELFTDERGAGLRASWRAEHSLVVLSLWRDDVCVGTFSLAPADALRLTEFVIGHLGATVEREAG